MFPAAGATCCALTSIHAPGEASEVMEIWTRSENLTRATATGVSTSVEVNVWLEVRAGGKEGEAIRAEWERQGPSRLVSS